jgi:hypothetical protein
MPRVRGRAVSVGNSRLQRRSRSQGFEYRPEAESYRPARRPSEWKGDAEVKYATRVLARRAKSAEKQWLRTLPKGVTV